MVHVQGAVSTHHLIQGLCFDKLQLMPCDCVKFTANGWLDPPVGLVHQAPPGVPPGAQHILIQVQQQLLQWARQQDRQD
jgi:hypothetical protein